MAAQYYIKVGVPIYAFGRPRFPYEVRYKRQVVKRGSAQGYNAAWYAADRAIKRLQQKEGNQ